MSRLPIAFFILAFFAAAAKAADAPASPASSASSAVSHAGTAVKHGMQKTGSAVERGAQKTGEVASTTAERTEEGFEEGGHDAADKTRKVGAKIKNAMGTASSSNRPRRD